MHHHLQKTRTAALQPPCLSPPPPTNAHIMTRSSVIKPLVLLPFLFLSVAATNFTQCLIDFQASNATIGGVDSNGAHVPNPEDAVGLTYEKCAALCGSGPELFEWSIFSQQFSSWLLPWLALVSQLPFGARNRLDNLLSGEFPSVPVGVFYRFLTIIYQLSSLSDLQLSQHFRSLSQPSTLAGPAIVFRPSTTLIAPTLPGLSSTSNRFHSI